MKRKAWCLAALAAAGAGAVLWLLHTHTAPAPRQEYAGSASCRECHESFYAKWSTSWHGLAMRPCTPAFARDSLSGPFPRVEIRGRVYWLETGADRSVVREQGPDGEKAYPIEQVLGGKNVLFFLTPRPGGKLQVLPLAFDIRSREYYDTTGSMVRHLPDLADEPLDWTERPLTFNTSCYGCHVSQLRKNYSIETDSYRSAWNEPGINCESCHGPGLRHVEAARALGDKVKDRLEIISTRPLTAVQRNSMCAPCHAKMSPLDAAFQTGEQFFDHYNLVALEDRDFYPDGRDLGENFTYTLWLMNPCSIAGDLDCIHCHSSSGRNKHAGPDADRACLPCHARHVENPAAHSHHRAESQGSRCVSCHMPETSFARMRRHDHTMLPPAPAATLKFGSPNACNLCHQDRDARWADRWVRRWYPRDYQAPLLHRAGLIEAARKERWDRLADMVGYVGSSGRNEVFAASLLRLMDRCADPGKWPAFVKALRDPSPLVRSSAAAGLAAHPDSGVVDLLVEAAKDPSRLVRVQAGQALAHHPLEALQGEARRMAEGAMAEFEASMKCQPDDPRSHYNLGNHYQERGDLAAARAEYEIALKLLPSFIPALVNVSVVHARLGNKGGTERALREALRYSPTSAEVNYNLGLFLAEQGRPAEAEACLRTALLADAGLAEAAYNLGVLLADRQPEEALAFCRRAATLRPQEARYAYTLAFYLHKGGRQDESIGVLRPLVERHPGYPDAYALLGAVYEETDRREEARRLYERASSIPVLPEAARQHFAARAGALRQR